MADERERVGAVYDRYAASGRRAQAWSATNAGNVALRAELADRVAPLAPAAARVLDVGCGTGWWLRELVRRGRDPATLHGVELLQRRADAAAATGARVVAGDAAALPFDDDAFGLVTLFTVLSSMRGDDRRAAALAEACRVLAPGGRLALWEPRWPNPRNPDVELVGRRLLRGALPGATVESITVLPPLARRLGARGYARASRVPVLRSHRLVLWRG